MTFSYVQEAGIIPTIKSISYGDISIEYDYDRLLIQKSFMNGYYLLDKYLLRHIRIVTKGTTLKQYDLQVMITILKRKNIFERYYVGWVGYYKLNSTRLNGEQTTKQLIPVQLYFRIHQVTGHQESNRNFTSSDIDGTVFQS